MACFDSFLRNGYVVGICDLIFELTNPFIFFHVLVLKSLSFGREGAQGSGFNFDILQPDSTRET